MQQRLIIFLDSHRESRSSMVNAHRLTNALWRYILDGSAFQGQPMSTEERSRWRIMLSPEQDVQQENDFDCGVHTCHNAKCIAQHDSLAYLPSSLSRSSMATEILHGTVQYRGTPGCLTGIVTAPMHNNSSYTPQREPAQSSAQSQAPLEHNTVEDT